MIQLNEQQCWTFVIPTGESSWDELQTLQSFLVLPLPEGTSHKWAEGEMISYLRPHDDSTWKFPRGFTSMIVERLRKYHINVQYEKPNVMRWSNTEGYDEKLAGLLNDHQRYVTQTVVDSDCGLVWAHPRFGKSYCMYASYVGSGRPLTIVITPAAIIPQVKREISEWSGEPVGHICAEVGPLELAQYTLVSPDSCVDEYNQIRPELRPYFDVVQCLFHDELHMGGARAAAIYEATPNRQKQIGWSGTPFTKEPIRDFESVGRLGPLLVKYDTAMGAKLGLIAGMEVRWIDVYWEQVDDFDSSLKAAAPQGSPQVYFHNMVSKNDTLNEYAAYLARYHMEAGDPVVIMVQRVDQGAIADLIPGAVACVGQISKKKKERIQEQFNAGEIQCVVATKRWRTGITLKTNVIINLELLQADHVTEQRFGRGLLTKDDGRNLILYEFSFHDHPRRMLYRWARARSRFFAANGWPQTNIGSITSGATE